MNICTPSADRLKYPLLLLMAVLLVSLSPSAASAALTIETTNIDGAVDIQPVGVFVTGSNTSKRTALMGRKECENAWNNNSPLVISYNFTQPVSIEQCSAGQACVDRIMFFAIPIDAQPDDFGCKVDKTNHCIAVDQTNLPYFEITNKTNTGFDIKVTFNKLVNDAVNELDASNMVKPIQSADDCHIEGEGAINQQYVVRLFMKNLGTNSDQTEYSDMVIEVDTKRPVGPSQIYSVAATESAIYATWEQAERRKIKDYYVHWSKSDFSGLSPADIEASDAVETTKILVENQDPKDNVFSGKASISSISAGDGARIFVAISSRDTAENLSPPTFPGEDLDPDGGGFEVVKVIDFWEHYREAGGGETGGCNVAPGDAEAPVSPAGLMLMLGAAGFWGWRRRTGSRHVRSPESRPRINRHFFTLLLAAALGFGAVTATATNAHAETDIHGIAEIRLGGYYPGIDEEAGLSGSPFEDIFGDSRRVLFEYEMGFHLFQGFGSLGLSGTVGYTSFGGDVIVEESSTGSGALKGTSETTEFMVIPLTVSAYYRFDILEKFWHIPLVPVAKAGVNYTLWVVDAANGETADYQGDAGKGGTFGWHVSGALHLWLDWIEPETAAGFDRTWGVNNSYLFAEYSHRQIDDFGSSESFNLSDDLWMFGIAFEY